MARSRGEEEEISIFNMSFLDVFCCTVGALIFILFIQTLRTRDMVERRALEETQRNLIVAQRDLTETEKARDKTKEELAKLTNEVVSAKAKVVEQSKTIGDLIKKLSDPNRTPVLSTIAGLPGTAQGSGSAMEAQKAAHGQLLLGNLETRVIVCASEGLYLGFSRKAIPIRNNSNLRPLFREFLRFHNPKQEQLWRTIWAGGIPSHQASIQLESSENSYVGQGLVVSKDTLMQEAQKAASTQKKKVVEFDLGENGKVQYEDTDGDGVLDIKRVNIDDDSFFEEIYMNWNPQTQTWGRLLASTSGDHLYDVLYENTVPGNSVYETMYLLPNLQTGTAVFRYEDTNNDGLWDEKYEKTDPTSKNWQKTYAQFDPNYLRWGAILEDTNGDGKPDVLWRDTDMSNDDWEEKLVDLNGDGIWDVRWKDLDPRNNHWEAKFTEHKGNTEIWQRCELDSDGDGVFDVRLVDTKGSGEWDEEYHRDATKRQWIKAVK